MIEPLRSFKVGAVQVHAYPDRETNGAAAAAQIAAFIRTTLDRQPEIAMIFAAGVSQNEMYRQLIQTQAIDWRRVVAFDMDEYIDLPATAPQAFANFLKARLFDKLPFKAVHLLNGQAENLDAECRRFATLLAAHPVEIVCAGIGENGHLAFNDPGVADFDDPAVVKIIEMDAVCRQQQVNDGEFATLDAVPTRAITLTIPALMRPPVMILTVPGPTKTNAVYAALRGPISPACPASVIRQHRGTVQLFVDSAAAGKL